MKTLLWSIPALAVLVALGTLVAPSVSRALPSTTRLESRDYVPLGASAFGNASAAWYLDLAQQRAVICIKADRGPTCESAPMPLPK